MSVSSPTTISPCKWVHRWVTAFIQKTYSNICCDYWTCSMSFPEQITLQLSIFKLWNHESQPFSRRLFNSQWSLLIRRKREKFLHDITLNYFLPRQMCFQLRFLCFGTEHQRAINQAQLNLNVFHSEGFESWIFDLNVGQHRMKVIR